MFSMRSAAPTWSRFSLALVVAVWLATVGNISLWKNLDALPEVMGWRGLGFMVAFGVAIAAVAFSLLILCAWPVLLKGVAVVMLISAAASSFFMLSYGIVIDASMMANVAGTDAREVADLLSWRLVTTLLFVGIVPAIWVSSRPLRGAPPIKRFLQNVLLAIVGFGVAIGATLLVFQDFASVMRNHKQIRYMINPMNGLYASVRLAIDQIPHQQKPLEIIGQDATLGASYQRTQRPLRLLLVVGETSRAANWQLGGYERPTNPELAPLLANGQLQYFRNVMSCGTNTAASLPCMFSALGKSDYEDRDGPQEGLLDVLQRAGLAVLWIDNQSGCKGVCDRVPTVNTRDLNNPAFCPNGECFDAVMLDGLDERIAQLPAVQRDKGVVVVLHQMGSHGPAYFKRAPEAYKAFKPECTSNALQSCDRQAVVNAYDNSIRYTDHLLAANIQWLSRQPDHDTAMWYVSDHGESLGENNLYLHGLPYSLAPVEQKHVPQVSWFSRAMQQRLRLDTTCLAAQADVPLTHDGLFHTLLALADVKTALYQASLDVTAACRQTN
jgi:lipid A ethanolaminephosphotransferase